MKHDINISSCCRQAHSGDGKDAKLLLHERIAMALLSDTYDPFQILSEHFVRHIGNASYSPVMKRIIRTDVLRATQARPPEVISNFYVVSFE